MMDARPASAWRPRRPLMLPAGLHVRPDATPLSQKVPSRRPSIEMTPVETPAMPWLQRHPHNVECGPTPAAKRAIDIVAGSMMIGVLWPDLRPGRGPDQARFARPRLRAPGARRPERRASSASSSSARCTTARRRTTCGAFASGRPHPPPPQPARPSAQRHVCRLGAAQDYRRRAAAAPERRSRAT